MTLNLYQIAVTKHVTDNLAGNIYQLMKLRAIFKIVTYDRAESYCIQIEIAFNVMWWSAESRYNCQIIKPMQMKQMEDRKYSFSLSRSEKFINT